ncbi:hypothetical protein AK972_3076 [Pseudomonas yamanorum]|nr:hypothetical protein AK972_3076 [Pseudomonas yamanorum]
MKADQAFIGYGQDHAVEVNFSEPLSQMPWLDSREVLIELNEPFKVVGNETNRREFHYLTWRE